MSFASLSFFTLYTYLQDSQISPTAIIVTPIANSHPDRGSNNTSKIPSPSPIKHTPIVFFNAFSIFLKSPYLVLVYYISFFHYLLPFYVYLHNWLLDLICAIIWLFYIWRRLHVMATWEKVFFIVLAILAVVVWSFINGLFCATILLTNEKRPFICSWQQFLNESSKNYFEKFVIAVFFAIPSIIAFVSWCRTDYPILKERCKLKLRSMLKKSS